MLAEGFNLQTLADAFRFLWDERSLIVTKAIEQLELSAIAVGIAAAIAVPLGVWLGHKHRGSFLAINVSNIGRALPSLAVICVGLPFFGIGHEAVIVALVVLAAPLMLTNSYVAVNEVDKDVVEAARGMGLTSRQLLVGVEVPLALPLIFVGIRTAAVYVVATATLAGVVGGGSLGDIIFNEATYFLSGVVGAALVVSALAFTADFMLAGLQRVLTPRGLRYLDSGRTLEEEPPSVIETAAA
jgi:osmoprotectant transport system permease protein